MSRAQESLEDRDIAIGAYIDGEMDAAARTAFARRLAAEPDLARRVSALANDKRRLSAIFGPVSARPLPPGWTGRIEAETARPRPLARSLARPPFARPLARAWMAAAASLLIAVGIGVWTRGQHPPDTILADAGAARAGTAQPVLRLDGAALPAPGRRDAMIASRLALPVRAPDLSRFGYRLVELDAYGSKPADAAIGLRYRDGQARELALYVRRSGGEPRFDLLRDGTRRVCVWQDDVVGAVISGEMSAGEMMRVASAAYSDLDL